MKHISTVSDWGRIFRDRAIWRPLVLEVLRRHRLVDNAAGVDLEPGRVAGTHAVFVVNGRWVVKLFGPFWPADHEQEVTALRLLAPKPHLLDHVGLPQLVAAGVLEASIEAPAGHAWPYVVTTFLSGTQLCDVWPALDAGDRRQIAAELGRTLAELHARPLGHSAAVTGHRRRWLRFQADQAAQAQQRHARWDSLPGHLLAELPAFLQRARPLPRADWRPALLHCDVTSEHILLQPASDDDFPRWRLAGLIDFGDAVVGDPEYEFPVLFLAGLSLDRAAFRAFLDAYGALSCPGTDLAMRLMAYMLLHVYPLTNGLPEQARIDLWGAASLDDAATALFGFGRASG